MLLLPGLVLVVLGILGLAGRGLFSSGSVARRAGVLGGVGAPVAVAIGVSLVVIDLLLTAVFVFGVDDGSSDGRDRGAAGGASTITRPRAVDRADDPVDDAAHVRRPTRAPSSQAWLGPFVAIRVDKSRGGDFPDRYDVHDELESPTVLRMVLSGADEHSGGSVRQCVTRATERCSSAVPFVADESGAAAFQFLAAADFLGAETGDCGAAGPRCTVVVEDDDGVRIGEVDTVFLARAPRAGRVSVDPVTGIEVGDVVTVSVEGYPPGAQVTATLCTPPEATGTARCGSPGPTAPLVVGPDGTGSTALRVAPGPVGTERRPCDRRSPCGVSVVATDVFTRAPVVEIGFAAPPGARYDPRRLGFGLGLAGVLLLVAVGLVRRTDWTPPREGDGHEIDQAAYADLDALVAALPPEEPVSEHPPARR